VSSHRVGRTYQIHRHAANQEHLSKQRHDTIHPLERRRDLRSQSFSLSPDSAPIQPSDAKGVPDPGAEPLSNRRYEDAVARVGNLLDIIHPFGEELGTVIPISHSPASRT
jgi:hypothetical protein